MTRSWNEAPELASEKPFGTFHAVDSAPKKKEIDTDRLKDLMLAEKPANIIQAEPQFETVWEPIPNSSQAFAIDTRAHHTLYHGARGPGKTITQLMRFRSRVGIGYGPYWRGVIFDREFKHLADLVAQGCRFFPQFEDGVEWKKSQSEYKWVWPTGEELLLRHVKNPEDYDAFHGHEYPFIGWNELTKQPTSFLYDKFMSVNRSSFMPEKHTPKVVVNGQQVYDTPDGNPLPRIPLEVFSTTNPNGPGHNWVKKRFITPAKNGQIVRKKITYFDELKGEEVEVTRLQVAIFGSFFENPYLDPIYRAGLIEACEKDPHLHACWIKGDWSVNSGGAIDDLWDNNVHIIDRFPIPADWKLDRSFDWGSTHPFSTVWWAEANGEEVMLPGGRKWCPARGSLIAIAEDYGTDQNGTNQGLKLSAKDVGIRIVKMEEQLRSEQWVKRKILPGPADNQIRNVTESDVDTIEFKMAQQGVRWTQSDKSPGSRINGLQLMRDRLQASKLKEGPGIYFMRSCPCCIELLPILPRDPDKPDDVDCWVSDTMVATPKGEIPIQHIKAGEFVNTPIGPRRVLKSYVSGRSTTRRLTLSNGKILEGTNDHKIFADGYGLLPLSGLVCSSQSVPLEESCRNICNTTEFSTLAGTGEIITPLMEPPLLMAELACIDKFGSITTDQYQTDFISTTLTTIQTIIASKTYNWSMVRNILDITWLRVSRLVNLTKLVNFGLITGDATFFGKMLKRCVKTLPKENLRALIVLAKLEQNTHEKNFATIAESEPTLKAIEQNNVQFAENRLTTSPTQQKKSKLVVQNAVGLCEDKLVYNLTIEQAGLFYANGVLSSNTDAEDHLWDAVRYRILRGSNRWITKLKVNWAR